MAHAPRRPRPAAVSFGFVLRSAFCLSPGGPGRVFRRFPPSHPPRRPTLLLPACPADGIAAVVGYRDDQAVLAGVGNPVTTPPTDNPGPVVRVPLVSQGHEVVEVK